MTDVAMKHVAKPPPQILPAATGHRRLQVSCTTHDDCIGINFVDSTDQLVGSGKGYCRSQDRGCYYCDAGAVFPSGQVETRNCMEMDNSVDGDCCYPCGGTYCTPPPSPSPPPTPPTPPPPLLSVVAEWMSERASDRAVIHPGVWPTTGDTYALHATFDAAATTNEGARRPPRAPPAAPAPLTTGPPRAQL